LSRFGLPRLFRLLARATPSPSTASRECTACASAVAPGKDPGTRR
jgi:hypothetical protein